MKNSIFGPVLSRRLGFSLGVDLTAPKACSYDCIYCQLSHTTIHSIERARFVDPEVVMDQLREALAERRKPDYITFSGTGEPTLSSDLGAIIAEIKKMSEIPVCLITNGSLLWRVDVAAEASLADLIVPSVDAVSEEVWRRINRPAEGLEARTVLRGIEDFCLANRGKIWLEVLLASGVNDSDEELEKIAAFIRRCRVEKVQLNTAARPPRLAEVKKTPPERMEEIVRRFDFGAPVEIIAGARTSVDKSAGGDLEKLIADLLERHPTTAAEMAAIFGRSEEEVRLACRALVERGEIEPTGDADGPAFFHKIDAEKS